MRLSLIWGCWTSMLMVTRIRNDTFADIVMFRKFNLIVTVLTALRQCIVCSDCKKNSLVITVFFCCQWFGPIVLHTWGPQGFLSKSSNMSSKSSPNRTNWKVRQVDMPGVKLHSYTDILTCHIRKSTGVTERNVISAFQLVEFVPISCVTQVFVYSQDEEARLPECYICL